MAVNPSPVRKPAQSATHAGRRLAKLWRSLGIPLDYAEARGMPLHTEARRLVSIGRAADDGQPLRLTPRAATAWARMRDAAARDGVTLLPLSAFRSVARQASLVRRRLAAGESLRDILRLVAAPGCSEHHTGRALDLASPTELRLETTFARTREYRWLLRHAARFGFELSYPRRNAHGIVFEPWHWCYRGNARPRTLSRTAGAL